MYLILNYLMIHFPKIHPRNPKKVSYVVPIFKSSGDRSATKNYLPVCLFVVCKVFEKPVNNRLVDHLEKCGLLTDFQYGFRSFDNFDKIARAFNRSEATRAVTVL